MKITLEITVNVEGTLAPERVGEIVASEFTAGVVLSENHGEGDAWAIEIEKIEIKEQP